MKMTLNAQEVMNLVLNRTADQLGCEAHRLVVVMKNGGAADIYLDQQPDAPITRKRKAKEAVAVVAAAPVVAEVQEEIPFVAVEEVEAETMPFTSDEPEFVAEFVTEDDAAVATADNLWG